MTDLDERIHNSWMGTNDETGSRRITWHTEARLRLMEARKRMNLTQRQMAEKTGWTDALADSDQENSISLSRLRHFEQGTRKIHVEDAQILERVFGVPDTWWMGMATRKEAAQTALERELTGKIYEPAPVDRGPDGDQYDPEEKKRRNDGE